MSGTSEEANAFSEGSVINVKLSDFVDPSTWSMKPMSSFYDLDLSPELLSGLSANELTIMQPSDIQRKALPLILAPPFRNLIGQAQTGTGKTTCFTIAMLARVDLSLKEPQIIGVSPTRELALQTYNQLKRIGCRMDVTILAGIRDMPRLRKYDHQIIIGTPGTLINLIRTRRLCTDKIKMLVLDEADVMLELEGNMHEQSLRIKNAVPKDCQILMFSATFPEEIRKFGKKMVPFPNEISMKREELASQHVRQFYVYVSDMATKARVALDLHDAAATGNTMIFCRRRIEADELAATLSDAGYAVVSLHGEFSTEERDAVMDAFRRGDCKVLITTNLLARGIDVIQVLVVINYDVPLLMDGRLDVDTYIHRIGRAGRFKRPGAAFTFVHDEVGIQHIRDLEKYFQVQIKPVRVDPEGMEQDVKRCL